MATPLTTPDPLQFGMILPSREVLLGDDPDARRLTRLAVDAERRGYDSLWVGDSPLARPRFDPLVVLAAVAAASDVAIIGTAALHGVLRQPVAAAWQLASVDRLSGGRLVVGLGAGFPSDATRAELSSFSQPTGRRFRRLVESIALWRAVWAGEGWDGAITVGDESWTAADLAGLVLPTRPSGPALWYAGDGVSTAAEIAGVFDGWLPYPPTADGYRAGWDRITAAAGGRRLTPAVYATVLVADDVETGRAALDAYCQAYYDLPLELVELVQLFRTGTVDQVATALDELVEAGARHLVLRIGSLTPERHLDELDDVIARVRRPMRPTEEPR